MKDYELVVSDDCSTDGTWELLKAIERRDPRIRAIRTSRNLGMAANANFAVQATSGEYVALLHHDDLYRKDLLEKWLGVLVRNPSAAFVFNAYGIFESDRVYTLAMNGECVRGTWLLNRYLLPRWGCPIRGTAMIRKSAWVQENGMREEFGLLADVDLWMRLASVAPVGYVAEPLITVRHARPSYYPEIYKSDSWSWPRQRLLYEIHASNRRANVSQGNVFRRISWYAFRVRLTVETMKWLMYAVIRQNDQMLISSVDSVTEYDLPPLNFMRRLLRRFALRRVGRRESK